MADGPWSKFAAPQATSAPTPQWSAVAKPGPYTTSLSNQDEQSFQGWVKQNNIPWKDSPTSDYDMRGFWKAQQSGDPNAKRATNAHFPDTWKTPYHSTFSNESQYALPNAGHWQGNNFIPPAPSGPWTKFAQTAQPPTSPQQAPPDKPGFFDKLAHLKVSDLLPESVNKWAAGANPLTPQDLTSMTNRSGIQIMTGVHPADAQKPGVVGGVLGPLVGMTSPPEDPFFAAEVPAPGGFSLGSGSSMVAPAKAAVASAQAGQYGMAAQHAVGTIPILGGMVEDIANRVRAKDYSGATAAGLTDVLLMGGGEHLLRKAGGKGPAPAPQAEMSPTQGVVSEIPKAQVPAPSPQSFKPANISVTQPEAPIAAPEVKPQVEASHQAAASQVETKPNPAVEIARPAATDVQLRQNLGIIPKPAEKVVPIRPPTLKVAEAPRPAETPSTITAEGPSELYERFKSEHAGKSRDELQAALKGDLNPATGKYKFQGPERERAALMSLLKEAPATPSSAHDLVDQAVKRIANSKTPEERLGRQKEAVDTFVKNADQLDPQTLRDKAAFHEGQVADFERILSSQDQKAELLKARQEIAVRRVSVSQVEPGATPEASRYSFTNTAETPRRTVLGMLGGYELETRRLTDPESGRVARNFQTNPLSPEETQFADAQKAQLTEKIEAFKKSGKLPSEDQLRDLEGHVTAIEETTGMKAVYARKGKTLGSLDPARSALNALVGRGEKSHLTGSLERMPLLRDRAEESAKFYRKAADTLERVRTGKLPEAPPEPVVAEPVSTAPIPEAAKARVEPTTTSLQDALSHHLEGIDARLESPQGLMGNQIKGLETLRGHYAKALDDPSYFEKLPDAYKRPIQERMNQAGFVGERQQGFYSFLERQLNAKMSNKASAEQVVGMLRNAGVSQQEIAGTGFDTFLNDARKSGKSISKQEALDFVAANKMKLEVTEKRGSTRDPEVERKIRDLDAQAAQGHEALWGEIRQKLGITQSAAEQLSLGLLGSTNGVPHDLESVQGYLEPENRPKLTQELVDRWRGETKRLDELGDRTDELRYSDPSNERARYERYTLPGGENYREILLRKPNQPLDTWSGDKDYHSAHFDEPNILAHLRLKDRVDAQGKKTLFVEEAQSDWARDARAQESHRPELERLKDLEKTRYYRALSTPELAEYNSLNQRWANAAKVPKFPFEGTWHELAMKHALGEAVKGGYDQIAWTTGEQQAERYGSQNLQEGGVHHKRLYDEMIPQFLGRYTKKWGGRVGETNITTILAKDALTPAEQELWRNGQLPVTPDLRERVKSSAMDVEVHALLITPEIRRGVSEGQRMYGGYSGTSVMAGMGVGGTIGAGVGGAVGGPVGAAVGAGVGAAVGGLTPAVMDTVGPKLTDYWLTNREDVTTLPGKLQDLGERVAYGLKSTKPELADALDRFVGTTGRGTNFRTVLNKAQGDRAMFEYHQAQIDTENEKAVPNKMDRIAIGHYLEYGGDEARLQEAFKTVSPKIKRGFEKALDLSPEARAAAEKLRAGYNEGAERAVAKRVIKNVLDDYVYHAGYKEVPPSVQRTSVDLGLGKWRTNPRMAKERVFASLAEAHAEGYISKDMDALLNFSKWQSEIQRAISTRDLLKTLTETHDEVDNKPIIAHSGMGTVVSDADRDPVMLINPSAKDSDISDYKIIGHNLAKDYQYVHTDPESGIPTLIKGDLVVHPRYEKFLRAMLEPSAVRKNPYLNAALTFSQTAKRIVIHGTGFHAGQLIERGAEYGVLPGQLDKVDPETNPEQMRLLYGGLTVGSYNPERTFGTGFQLTRLAHEIPVTGRIADWMHHWMFEGMDSLSTQLKMTVGVRAQRLNDQIYGDKPGWTPDRISQKSADQVNAPFGGLNLEALGRSKTVQDWLQITSFAPDFLEGTVRSFAQAFRPEGAVPRRALLRGALMVYGSYRVMNMAINGGDPRLDKPFSVMVGDKEYSFRNRIQDAYRFFKDPRIFLENRESAVAKTGVQLLTGRDTQGYEKTPQDTLKDLVKGVAPTSIQRWMKDQNNPWLDSMFASVGITSKYAQTDAESLALKFRAQAVNKGAMGDEEKARLTALRNIRNAQRDKDSDKVDKLLGQASDSGVISDDDADKIYKNGDEEYLPQLVKGLSAENAMDVYRHASKSERELIEDMVQDKVSKAIDSKAPQIRDRISKEADDLFK